MKLPALPIDFQPLSSSWVGKASLAAGSLLLGNWVFNDLFHVPGGGFGLVVVGAGIWWLARPGAPARFEAPSSVEGWTKRCQQVLDQFENLEEEADTDTDGRRQQRLQELDAVLEHVGPQSLAVVGSGSGELPDKSVVESAIAGSTPLTLCWARPLSHKDDSWLWPVALHQQDALLYVLPLPLMAADLLWLDQVPDDQPAWVIVSWSDQTSWIDQLEALQAQLPARWNERVLRWSGQEDELRLALHPARRLLEHPQRNLNATRQRLLCRLHRTWQAELEQLRRQRFTGLQQGTQWLVAGAVFASPVPSADLLAIAVANGLMIKEMAKIWSCSWQPDSLQIAAKHLAGAALAQGVVEWSSQALLGVAKLEGTSWMAAGTMQALSAAYLTRVVGRSMADWLALNSGVDELDLEELKRQAPLLVAKAAETERLDWAGFLQQATRWVRESAGKSFQAEAL